jgi:Ca-activated chloride channel family protein
MSFAWPPLLCLLLLPAGLAAWEWTRRIRADGAAHPKILRAEAGQGGLRLTETAAAPGRGHARWWLAAGLALAIVALARPQWGRIDEPVFDQSREVLLALDLSRSMLTPDVKPSRLDRSKLLIQALLDRLNGERVGLVVFSGTAFLQSPLSADYEILREFLPSLNPEFMPEGGTNYAALIDTAAAAFGTSAADRFMIVLSDGGANDEGWQSHLSQLKAKGIRVIALGVGTAAGALIPDGAGGLVKDDRGAAVLSRLDSGSLRELADKTGGVYRDASEWVDLASLLRATVDAGRKGKFTEKNNVRLVERYQWALAPALLCLLLSFWREFPVRPRSRDIQLGEKSDAGEEARPNPAVRRAGAAAVLALLLAGGAGLTRLAAEPTDDPASPAALAHIVGRLAAADTRSARDWAELAGETLSWGGRVQSAQQPVPEGPVHDALASVEAGSALDPHAADWPKLRAELEGLLQKPPSQQQQPQNQQQQKQQQQNQSQSQQQQQQQNSDQSQSQQQQQQQQQGQSGQNPQQNPQKSSAFGDMKQPPPPASDQTQKVGGASERQQQEAAKADPALAASLEKMDQIKGQDSPAELFQMIENNEPHPKTARPGKDW